MILLSFSRSTTEKMNGRTVAFLSPIWEGLTKAKMALINAFDTSNPTPKFEHQHGFVLSMQEEMQRLRLENQLLLNQLTDLQVILDEKQLLDRQLKDVSQASLEIADILPKESYQKYHQRMKSLLDVKINCMPARVIFRSLDTWNNSLWINVGTDHNIQGKNPIIAKNSPVLVGDSVVGVIDYVGRRQARVRLITDNTLTPSVRVARGGEQDGQVVEHIDFLLHRLKRTKKLIIANEDRESLSALLKELRVQLQPMRAFSLSGKRRIAGVQSSSRSTYRVDFAWYRF